MNFGVPRMEVHEPRPSVAGSERVRRLFARRRIVLRGTHWLVVHPGRWQLTLADGLAVRDTASVRRLDMAVARLEGERLQGAAIDPRSGRTEFFFDLGGRIVVRGANAPKPHQDPEDRELWSMHDRKRFVAVFAAGGYASAPLSQAAENPAPIGTAEWVVVARATDRRRILRTLREAAV